MSAATTSPPEPTPRAETAGIRIASDLADMAAIVAQSQGISIAKVIDPVIRPFLVAAYITARREMDARLIPNELATEG